MSNTRIDVSPLTKTLISEGKIQHGWFVTSVGMRHAKPYKSRKLQRCFGEYLVIL